MSLILNTLVSSFARQLQGPECFPGHIPTFTENLAALKQASLQDIQNNTYDEAFASALKEAESSISKVKELAYTLFSGARCDFFRKVDISILGLNYLLVDKYLGAQDLCQVVKQTFESLKKLEILKEGTLCNSTKLVEWEGLLGEYYSDNEMVAVHHGGGLRHIKSFINEEKGSGYKCDSPTEGIFLTPFEKKYRDKVEQIPNGKNIGFVKELVLKSRTPNYATRTPLQHCDEPYYIIGLVPKKYLRRVNHNSYEAVLDKKYAKHFTIVFWENVNKTVDQLRSLNKNKFLNKFDYDPALKKRLEQALNRVDNMRQPSPYCLF